MIHLTVALRAEARPLVDAFELEALPGGQAPFPVFVGRRARLVVSGVGSIAAAAATAYLEARYPGEAVVWMNAGVAGHRDFALGTVVVAHKVVEQASGRVWYPTLVVEPRLPTATVRTVARPVARPEDEALYEMEAAGFVATALRWTTSERIAVAKVVSDHGVTRPRSLDRAEVSARVEASAAAIVDHAEAMEGLVRERSESQQGDFLDDLRRRFRFSVTEGHRLSRLANRAAVLGVSRRAIEAIDADGPGEFMRRLEERLDAAAIER